MPCWLRHRNSFVSDGPRTELEFNDQRHLRAAQGWFELAACRNIHVLEMCTLLLLANPHAHHGKAHYFNRLLGNCIEARKELEEITPEMRGNPSVLEVRYEIYAAAKKWDYAAEIAKAISLINS
jgi:hypothetical protein